jgi:GT2 family glycosyltransferase
LLERCLPSVVEAAAAADCECEVVVLDNGSTDRSLDWVRENCPRVRCVRATANRFLVSYNEFLRQDKHRLAFLLNSDVVLERDCLPPLLRHFADPQIFCVAPLVLNKEGEQVENGRTCLEFSQGRFRYRQADLKPGLTATASTAAGMYDREKLLAFGGFDDLLLPMYGEEMDLTLSAYRRGWVVRFEPQSVAHHLGGATINKAVAKRQRRKYLVKNRHLSMIKHVHSWRLLIGYCLWTILLLPVRVLTLDRAYFAGTWLAVRQFGHAVQRRRREQADAALSDREVFCRLSQLKGAVTFVKQNRP